MTPAQRAGMRGQAGKLSGLARMARAVAAAALTGAVVSACGSPSAGPLIGYTGVIGDTTCVPAPDLPGPINQWDTPIGFTSDWFINVSRSTPVTVESVTLLHPHNLVLRGALVYEMAHSQHPLIQNDAWSDMGTSVPVALWARRQPVPGAVIPPYHGPGPPYRPSYKLNIYIIAAEVSDATPDGGWALGESVTYRADGHTYTVNGYTGFGIGVPGPNFCQVQIKAMEAAIKAGADSQRK